jgi:hypothetical protein
MFNSTLLSQSKDLRLLFVNAPGAWVPHLRRVFVFAPKVGYHECNLTVSELSFGTWLIVVGAPYKLRLGGDHPLCDAAAIFGEDLN